MLDLLTLHEAAAALRLSGCAPCDLVRCREVPCARIGGRWLVPLATLAAWVAARVEGAAPPDQPPILAGSDDPLLAWALRESRCGLALLAEGSLAGLDALAECCLVLAALHVPDPGGSGWNVPLIEARMPHARLVAIGLAAHPGADRAARQSGWTRDRRRSRPARPSPAPEPRNAAAASS